MKDRVAESARDAPIVPSAEALAIPAPSLFILILVSGAKSCARSWFVVVQLQCERASLSKRHACLAVFTRAGNRRPGAVHDVSDLHRWTAG